jgi:hypothetical protein
LRSLPSPESLPKIGKRRSSQGDSAPAKKSSRSDSRACSSAAKLITPFISAKLSQ